MVPNQRNTLLASFGAVILSLLSFHIALAQEIPTPTPLPKQNLPPGDTTILVVGAVILVLIVFGAMIWTSRRGTHH